MGGGGHRHRRGLAHHLQHARASRRDSECRSLDSLRRSGCRCLPIGHPASEAIGDPHPPSSPHVARAPHRLHLERVLPHAGLLRPVRVLMHGAHDSSVPNSLRNLSMAASAAPMSRHEALRRSPCSPVSGAAATIATRTAHTGALSVHRSSSARQRSNSGATRASGRAGRTSRVTVCTGSDASAPRASSSVSVIATAAAARPCATAAAPAGRARRARGTTPVPSSTTATRAPPPPRAGSHARQHGTTQVVGAREPPRADPRVAPPPLDVLRGRARRARPPCAGRARAVPRAAPRPSARARAARARDRPHRARRARRAPGIDPSLVLEARPRPRRRARGDARPRDRHARPRVPAPGHPQQLHRERPLAAHRIEAGRADPPQPCRTCYG